MKIIFNSWNGTLEVKKFSFYEKRSATSRSIVKGATGFLLLEIFAPCFSKMEAEHSQLLELEQ